MKIRKASVEDLPEIIELWKKANLPIKVKGRDALERLIKQLESEVTWFLIAEVDQTFVGAVVVTHDQRKGWINRLATHPEYRRKGIGLQLLKASEELLLEMGIDVFAALIEKNNLASRELFGKNQYKYNENITYYSKKITPES